MRLWPFVTGNYYHVYNRGVDRRETFLDDIDRARFLGSLESLRFYEDVQGVSIIAYALMPNHYHFLFQQIDDGGISKLMQRLGTSYTQYFNKRYGRSGSLFESTYKAVAIESTGQLLHTSRYIHLNPLDLSSEHLFDARWRWLTYYYWSSLWSYLGYRKQDFIDSSKILQHFQDGLDYQNYLQQWIEVSQDSRHN